MRGIGKGLSNFKKGMNDIEDEIKKPIDEPEKKDNKTE
jgi:Sec-independent protein translocase protein TatA